MKKISSPTDTYKDIIDLCSSDKMKKQELKSKCQYSKIYANQISDDYKRKAENGMLHNCAQYQSSENKVIFGTLNHADLSELYTNYFSKKGKPARAIYDRLMAMDRCVFCDVSGIEDLDHVLPHSVYPQFAVLPQNLVPTCSSCNRVNKKSICPTSASNQFIHPYFDKKNFFMEQWLDCELTIDETALEKSTIIFFCNPPSSWTQSDAEKIEFHFFKLNLKSKFENYAIDELASSLNQIYKLKHILSAQELIEQYVNPVVDTYKNRINHWRRVTYLGLKNFILSSTNNNVSKFEICPRCKNTDFLGGCDLCNGVGMTALKFNENEINEPVNCPNCLYGEDGCDTCHGEGFISVEKARNFNK